MDSTEAVYVRVRVKTSLPVAENESFQVKLGCGREDTHRTNIYPYVMARAGHISLKPYIIVSSTYSEWSRYTTVA